MSGDDAITTLAMRVEELARELDEARQATAAARAAVARWNARLTTEGIGPTLAMRRDIKNLRADLDALAATLGTALDQGKLKAPVGPRWDNLDQDQEAVQLARLREWVNGVLRVQYPGYKLPDCWEAHREALWELGALHAEWQRVFGDPRGPGLENMLWFHERWLPGTLSRLDKAIANTNLGCPQHGYAATGGRAASR